MKKKSFLSGISAKLALAAVALTSVMLISCEKEDFKIEPVTPVELPAASATVIIKAYDLSTGQEMTAAGQTEKITGDAITGKIAAATKTYSITAPGYVSSSITVNIPALEKGQSAVINQNVYLIPMQDIVKDPVLTEDPATEVPSAVNQDVVTAENTGDTAKEMSLEYNAQVGQTILNISEVNAWIDANIPSTKAISNEELRTALKNKVKSYNSGISKVVYTKKVTVAAKSIIELTPVTSFLTSTNSLSVTVEGKSYTIPNLQIKKAIYTIVNEKSISTEHGHDHGHGGSGNAGGGEGGK